MIREAVACAIIRVAYWLIKLAAMIGGWRVTITEREVGQ